MLKTLGPKAYHEGAQEYRITAKYGIDYDFAKRNHQAPYFSITGSIDRKARNGRWMDDAGGTIHEDIAAHFPELEPYLKWHLVSDEGPMHYIENAKYWLDVARGKTSSHNAHVDPAAAFESTIVLGALPDDMSTIPDLKTAEWPEVKRWLEDRLPRLLEAYRQDMETLGVLETAA